MPAEERAPDRRDDVEHDPSLFAVVMAGGSGTRFWPASRRARPKQFLRVVGSRSLLQATVDRLAPLVAPERVLVVGAEAHMPLVREQLPHLPPENLLGEPCARGTLPCAAWAASVIARRDPLAVMALLPADHVISPEPSFRAALARAARAARAEEVPVVFGVRPTHPATGFGWIETDGGAGDSQRLVRFVEKPGRDEAVEFLASGRFAWNGGVFVWSVPTFDALLSAHAPAVRAAFARERSTAPAAFDAAFRALDTASIDVGIMERVAEARVISADFNWSDVGSWPALSEVLDPDAEGNCAGGGAQLVALEAERCIVHGPRGTLTALVGVADLVVARDGDVVLVAHRDRAQDVRAIVARLEAEDPGRL